MSDPAAAGTVLDRAERLPGDRGRPVSIQINGREVTGYEGESLASLLLVEGLWAVQADRGRDLGLFCNIGQCHGCLVTVNGRERVRACRTSVKDGLVVQTGRKAEQ